MPDTTSLLVCAAVLLLYNALALALRRASGLNLMLQTSRLWTQKHVNGPGAPDVTLAIQTLPGLALLAAVAAAFAPRALLSVVTPCRHPRLPSTPPVHEQSHVAYGTSVCSSTAPRSGFPPGRSASHPPEIRPSRAAPT